MKLTGNLKKQVEKAETKDEEIRKADFSELSAQSRTGSPLPSVGGSDEKKSLIENAGMLLNDDELEMVSGGMSEAQLCYKNPNGPLFGHKWVQLEGICKCKYCEVDRTFVIYNKRTPLPKNLMDLYLDINGCN